MAARLKECGVTLDISGATRTGNMFAWSNFSRLPALSLTGFTATHANYSATMFSTCQNLISIEKIIVTNLIQYYNMFAGCKNLQDIKFEGAIAYSIDFKDCKKLTAESVTSIINTLSSDVTGQTVTFSKAALKSAFGVEITSDSDIPADNDFYDLRWSKPNWTFGYSN